MKIFASGSPVESVQRGQITLERGSNSDITVSEFDINKSFLNISCANGYTQGSSSGSGSAIIGGGSIVDATTINIKTGSSGSSGGSIVIYWELIEYV